MNTVEIEKTVAKDHCLKPCFLGVFASDELPHIDKYPVCFIANTHASEKPGEHWIAMFFNGTDVEYFDSYGMKPRTEFKIYNPNVVNKYCLQNIDSVVCGEYCIFYLHKRIRGVSLDKLVYNLRRRSNSDNFVKNYINRLRVKVASNIGQSCRCRGQNEGC